MVHHVAKEELCEVAQENFETGTLVVLRRIKKLPETIVWRTMSGRSLTSTTGQIESIEFIFLKEISNLF